MEKNISIRSIIIIYGVWWINTLYIEGGRSIERSGVILTIIIMCYYIIRDKKTTKKEDIVEVLLVVGIISLINLENLISLFISMELINVITYTVLYKRGNIENYNNILYYFFINSLSSLLLLYSFLMIYKESGSTNIHNMDTANMYPVYMALMIKLGAGPFYYWKVITYSKVETIRVLLISVIPNFIYIYILSLFITEQHMSLLFIFIILSLLIGSIAYLTTDYFNRLLIYSSTYNIGLIIYNLCISTHLPYDYNPYVYIIVYSINMIGFTILVDLYHKGDYMLTYTHLVFMTIFLFSLIGFPPFGGFFIKFYLIYSSLFVALPSSFFFSFLILFTSILAAPLYLKFYSFYYFFHKGIPNLSFPPSHLFDPFVPSSVSFFSLFLLSFYFLLPYLAI